MRRLLIVALPIITLLIFVFIMLSGGIFKRPLGEDDNVPGTINNMIEAVTNDAWEDADSKLKDLEKAWNKIIFRVQFSSERDEINRLTTSIARLQGAVKAEDKGGALMELYEAYSHWEELAN